MTDIECLKILIEKFENKSSEELFYYLLKTKYVDHGIDQHIACGVKFESSVNNNDSSTKRVSRSYFSNKLENLACIVIGHTAFVTEKEQDIIANVRQNKLNFYKLKISEKRIINKFIKNDIVRIDDHGRIFINENYTFLTVRCRGNFYVDILKTYQKLDKAELTKTDMRQQTDVFKYLKNFSRNKVLEDLVYLGFITNSKTGYEIKQIIN